MKRLDEIEARTNAATEGPWRYVTIPEHGGFVEDHMAHDIFTWLEDDAGTIGATDEDAEFIAHARQDVPTLVAALRAVLELHVRAECPTCGSRDGEGNEFHKCDDDAYCEECDLEGYPCPTVAAIQKHFGETETL